METKTIPGCNTNNDLGERKRLAEKPLVSILFLTYNQRGYVVEALRSALSQTYRPLEIIVSDDCSLDGTYEVVLGEVRAYDGPHRVITNRNAANLGLAGNLNAAYALSSGAFLVAQAGDDISLPGRVELLVRRWMDLQTPVDLVVSFFEEIDAGGKPTGFIKEGVAFVPDTSKRVVDWACGATGACAAYSRKLFEKYGPLNRQVISEDWVLSFRAWLESGISVIKLPLVKHRTHDGSIAVMHRTVKAQIDPAKRRKTRLQAAQNRYAIACEWLHAWGMSGLKGTDMQIEGALRRLVYLRELELKAHDSKRLRSLFLAGALLVKGGGFKNMAKLLVRHLLRWD